MTLISGRGLSNPRQFFSVGLPKARSSSYDLTIGTIIDHEGKTPVGPFSLKPGHMVQVVSAEVFDLPSNVTGHVTYKTDLTRNGVWALTVGIVDPGWTGPVSTTLLNFSRVDFPLKEKMPFLRVSLFEHAPVSAEDLPVRVEGHEYREEVRAISMTKFPKTFLDAPKIVSDARDELLQSIQARGVVWVTLIATLFTVIQLVLNFSAPKPAVEAGVELNHLIKKVDELEARLPPAGKIEQSVGGAKPLSPPPYGSSSELSSVPSHSPSGK